MEILTIGDLAKELQVSESTIFRWLRAGLPHIKIGRLVRFKKDRVEKYLDRMSSDRHRLIRRTKGGCP
ncbi:MAG TPA: helix-turn-helix domain-containing protein [Candidatus Latescibacteria bacterium]|nr:helix-turn-helix domain-containing protein [Candidatus Latescibacterota bacterium]